MSCRKALWIAGFFLVASATGSRGQSFSSGHSSIGSYSTFTGSASNAGQSLGINFPGYGSSFGPSSGPVYPTPPVVIGVGSGWPYYPVYQPQPIVQVFPVVVPEQGRGGLMLPMPPRQLAEPVGNRPRRPNPERAKELVEIGDRQFRVANIHRAEERYFQAAKADPTAPMPYIHLAQVSLVRKDYKIAAERIRTALDSAQGSGWLANASDIQTMFGEPGDFARQMAALESHLQANPGDRDAWFLLGVEWYLSGRTQQAADAFQRLTDRRPDPALAAFLDATKTQRPPAN